MYCLNRLWHRICKPSTVLRLLCTSGNYTSIYLLHDYGQKINQKIPLSNSFYSAFVKASVVLKLDKSDNYVLVKFRLYSFDHHHLLDLPLLSLVLQKIVFHYFNSKCYNFFWKSFIDGKLSVTSMLGEALKNTLI